MRASVDSRSLSSRRRRFGTSSSCDRLSSSIARTSTSRYSTPSPRTSDPSVRYLSLLLCIPLTSSSCRPSPSTATKGTLDHANDFDLVEGEETIPSGPDQVVPDLHRPVDDLYPEKQGVSPDPLLLGRLLTRYSSQEKPLCPPLVYPRCPSTQARERRQVIRIRIVRVLGAEARGPRDPPLYRRLLAQAVQPDQLHYQLQGGWDL